jgi:anti-anti-sigma factor
MSAGPGEAVRLDGELDEATAGPLGARLHLRAIERGGRLVVDLTDVRHIGSAGIRMLSQLADDLRREGGALEVVAPPGTMARRILDLTGLAATILPPGR